MWSLLSQNSQNNTHPTLLHMAYEFWTVTPWFRLWHFWTTVTEHEISFEGIIKSAKLWTLLARRIVRQEFLFEQNWPKLASFRFWSSILLSWLILPFVFLEITSASCLGIRVKLLPNTRQKADINYVIGYYRPCLRDEEEFSPKASLDFDRQ